MAETSQPRMAALDRPALGLVIQLAVLIALPAQLRMGATMVLSDPTWSTLSWMGVLQLVAAGLQIATGIAIARRSWARPLFAACSVAALASAAGAVIAFRPDASGLVLNERLFDIIAGPVMILIAPVVIDVRRLADQRSPADVAAALTVLALGSLLAIPLDFADQVRFMVVRHAEWTILLNPAIVGGLDVVIAIVALHAVRALLRPGPPEAARRALALYVVVSIAIGVGLRILSIVIVFGAIPRSQAALMLFTPVSGAVLAGARPLVIWGYARPALRAPITADRTAMSGLLTWGVLWFAPLLVLRSLLLAPLHPDSGIELTVAVGALLSIQAVVNLVAVRTASQDPERGFRTAAAAIATGVVLLGTVTVWLYALFDLTTPAGLQFSASNVARPLTLMLAMLGTLAWIQRRAAPRLPRATVVRT